jgi:YbbR domain-containing protein
LAVVAWIVVTLSNSYNYTVKEVLSFKNIPQKRAFHSLQSDTVNVTVQGSGWQMVVSKLNAANKIIKVDLRTLDSDAYIVLSSQLQQINDERALKNKIIAFSPDTLFFDFSNRSVRKVPVQLITAIKFQQQFAQSGKIVIKPSYVTISGPSNRIDKITSWRTDSLAARDVSEPINTRINLVPPTEGNISIYPKDVQVTLPVDEFTEKTMEIPVKLMGNDNYFDVKIFPQKVKVTFTTSLSRYADITEDMFEVQANLDLWRLYGYDALPVKVRRMPAYCKIVKIEPRNIDFIIKK